MEVIVSFLSRVAPRSLIEAPSDPDNTRTPLIAWGAGVRGPLPDSKPSSHDEYSEPWGLSHLFRRDVEQADITALMCTILGIKFPANSVGVLPDIDTERPGYLNLTGGEAATARAAVANAKVCVFSVLCTRLSC